MNKQNMNQNSPTTSTTIHPKQYDDMTTYLSDCKLAYEQMHLDKTKPWLVLRWLHSLCPTQAWRSVVAKAYEAGDYVSRSWSFAGYMRNLYRTYRIWFPGEFPIEEAISGAAVLAIFLSNPTPMNVGLYLIYLSRSLRLDIGLALNCLLKLMGKALEFGISSLKQLIEKMISWISMAKQDPEQCEPTGHNDGKLIENETFINAILTMIGTAVASVQGACLDSLSYILGTGTKKLGNITKAMKSTEYLYAKMHAFVELIVGCINPDKKMMDLARALVEHDLKLEGKACSVSEFLQAVLSRSTPEAASRMKGDITYLRSSQQLLHDGKLIMASMTLELRQTMLPLLQIMERVVFEAANQSIIPVRKFEPFHACFVGEPNIGKSVVLNVLLSFFLQYLQDRPEYDLPCDDLFHAMAWTENQNFANGYMGQYILAMDDICKESKPTDTGSSTFLINAVSPIGMNVEGAGLESKRNPFNSKIIFSTSNDRYPSAQSAGLKSPHALWSRRHRLVETEKSDRLDPDLNRHIQFRFRDAVDPRAPMGPSFTFREMAVRVLEAFIKHYKHEMSLLDSTTWAREIYSTSFDKLNQMEADLADFDVRANYSRGQNEESMSKARKQHTDMLEDEDIAGHYFSEKCDATGICRVSVDLDLELPPHEFNDDHDPENPVLPPRVENPFVNPVDEEELAEIHYAQEMDRIDSLSMVVYEREGVEVEVHRGQQVNYQAVAAVCFLINETTRVVIEGGLMTFTPINTVDGMLFHQHNRFDFERALLFMRDHQIPVREIFFEMASIPAEIARNYFTSQVLTLEGLEFPDVYNDHDELFDWEAIETILEGDRWFENQSRETDCECMSWDSDECEPTGLIDPGTVLRIRVQGWIKTVHSWKGYLGIGLVLSALVAGGLYVALKKNPTYAGTNLAHKLLGRHDELSSFGHKKWKNVHCVNFGRFTCSGFFYNQRSMLTVKHTTSMARQGELVTVSFPNGKDYSEPFDSRNLEFLVKGSDLAIYHFQNTEIPMAPDSRGQFATHVPKEICDVEVLMPFLSKTTVARYTGPFHYKTGDGEVISHRAGLKVSGQLGKGQSGSIMVIPGINRIVGIQVSQNIAETQFEHITRDHFPDDKVVQETQECEMTALKYVGPAEKKVSMNQRTSFKPSMLSRFMSVLFATTYSPSVLSANDKRMDEPCDDILMKSMKGYDHEFKHLDSKVIEQVIDEISMEDNVVRDGKRRLLTDHEILNGSDELNVKPLDITTAPGLPWCHEAKLKGKRDFIVNDLPNRTMVPKLRNSVLNYDFDKNVLGYACLKDELRPEAKIKKGATRSFIVLPMDFNLKLREYFGAFIGVQHSLAGTISSCVGINPYEHWDSLYQRLAVYADQFEDFDYADWDRTLSPDWFIAYAHRTNKWYNDGPVNAERRVKLMKQLAFAYVQIGDKIFETEGGNKSGCAITAELNTDVHEMKLLYCWIILAKIHDKQKASLYWFRKCNALLLYGDDVVKATRWADWFNGNNIKPISESLGMIITPADKVSTTFELKEPQNITFLKRSFGERKAPGKMMCPLSLPSITKMVHYTRRNENEHEVTKMNVDCAVKEMFFHGKEKYDNFLVEVQTACREAKLECIPVWKSWETLEEEWIHGDMEPPTYW